MGLLGLLLPLQSCTEYESVEESNFEVVVSSKTFKAGEPIAFTVNNAPDFLNFYSGEAGHEYRYRERTQAEGAVSLSFQSSQQYGIKNNAVGTLSLLYSKDYDGSGTVEAVSSATWTDISDSVTFSEEYDLSNWIDSGAIDITDIGADGQPVYFAFKFKSNGHRDNGNRQPTWHIRSFLISLVTETINSTVADLHNPGWLPVDVAGFNSNPKTGNWYLNNTFYRLNAGPMTEESEDWLITNSVNLTSVDPDKGMSIKSYSSKLESFNHTYTEPGTYMVTFVGKNTTIYGSTEKIQEFTLTIEE